jgi:nucleoside-diphosphate-sugar epimerase
MRILVLGGASFVGRAIVEDALATGAGVTLFGRGRTRTDLFGELTLQRGDRDTGDYAALADGTWDAACWAIAWRRPGGCGTHRHLHRQPPLHGG